jgi:hypothetical protein
VNALALSIIRTYVPIIVGALASWLLVTFAFQLEADVQAHLIIALTGLLQAVYYAAVRALETRFPGVGVLLGAAKTPDTYSKGEGVPAVTVRAVPPVDVSGEVELPPLDAPGPDHRA